jgi:hypothetical protein
VRRHVGKRFRILDIHTPWFWFVSFYVDDESCQKLEAFCYSVMVPRWWVYALRWEDKPDMRPMVAVPRDESEALAGGMLCR